MARTRTVIMGAAGRDFHDFLVRYRDDESTEIVAFTATQIPGIDDRTFPAEIAGPLYPNGIPIVHERELSALIKEQHVDLVVFAYSDIAHVDLMHKASQVIAAAPTSPCSARTRPCCHPPSRSSRCAPFARALARAAFPSALWRHSRSAGCARSMSATDAVPRPAQMRVERYATIEDLDSYGVTIEEREEYEHMVVEGMWCTRESTTGDPP